MRVNFEGTCVAARASRDAQGVESDKYVDVKVLVGESVVRAWGFRDSLSDEFGLPVVGEEIRCVAYVQAAEPKKGGQPYLKVKVSSWEPARKLAATVS